MAQVPMDKYLQGPAIASQQAIQEVVQSMLAQLIAPRDEAINAAFQQLAAKAQQLEALLTQVTQAVAAPKMSPFEVATKTLQFFGDDETDEAAKRCHDKAVSLIERWLDAGLATSETGSGDARRTPSAAHEAEAEDHGGEVQHQPPPPGDRTQEISAEND